MLKKEEKLFKKIIVFLSDYPYGMGEPFFEKELIELSSCFNEILLVNTSEEKHVERLGELFEKPENVSVLKLLPEPLSVLDYLREFYRLRFYREIINAIFYKKIKISKSLLADVLYYSVQSRVYSNKIKRMLKDRNINVQESLFYSYWTDFYSLSLSILKKKKVINHLVTKVHGWDLYFDRHPSNYLPFREFIFNQADKVFSISKKGVDYILHKKLIKEKSKVCVSYLGVYYENNQVPIRPFDKLKILSISHINKVKRLDRIVSALKQINEFDIEWTHVGYGEQDYEMEFQKWAFDEIENRKNVTIIFEGYKDKDEIESLLKSKQYSLFVNSSESEGIPVSIMEAMCFGYPVLAFDVGGINEIVINGINGYLLPQSDDESANNLKNILTSYFYLPIDKKNSLSLGALNMWNKNFNSQNNYKGFAKLISRK